MGFRRHHHAVLGGDGLQRPRRQCERQERKRSEQSSLGKRFNARHRFRFVGNESPEAHADKIPLNVRAASDSSTDAGSGHLTAWLIQTGSLLKYLLYEKSVRPSREANSDCPTNDRRWQVTTLEEEPQAP